MVDEKNSFEHFMSSSRIQSKFIKLKLPKIHLLFPKFSKNAIKSLHISGKHEKANTFFDANSIHTCRNELRLFQ